MSNKSPRIGGEYGEVRATIDIEKLNSYIIRNVKHIRAPIEVKQFKFGQSNPTYFLTDSAKQRFVLRKKPAGQLLSKTAHQIEREYTILRALHKHNTKPSTPPSQIVPVPQPFILCTDGNVIGTPFYIMEFLDGRIFTDPALTGLPPTDRRECWLSAVRTLAALSSLSPVTLGISNFGPNTDYFPRQIKSLSKVSAAQSEAVDVETGRRTGKIPYFDELISWYREHLPDESKTGLRIVHGDYKMDNLVFHPSENRVIGILDWELCTLGSPLADFGNLTQPWTIDTNDLPNDPIFSRFNLLIGFKNSQQDVPIGLEELEREYSRLANQPYPIVEMVFVRSWTIFRLAVISQGIAARYARRQASSENAFTHPRIFPVIGNLARLALEDEGIRIPLNSKL